ncbi:hypothetical protein H7100_00855 [Candidatus Saccharibacteria bacterium]|nr:hypothetical protein [Candidatus Saccharibacteria bacterium]
MSMFPKITPAPTPKTKDTKHIAVFYAVVLVVMAVAQLFTFDDFMKLLVDFGLPGGVPGAHFLGAFLVTAEVFALPFLLRMSLSTAFRWVSMVLGWIVAGIWTVLTSWLVIRDTVTSNVGLLGTNVNLMPGWWAICISLSFGILAAWAAWGMWPYQRSIKRGQHQQK